MVPCQTTPASAAAPPAACTAPRATHCRQWQPGASSRQQRRRLPPPPAAAAAPQGDQPQPADGGAQLASQFAALVNEQGGPPPLLRSRRPTHLMSPIACIEAQMEALQRNDWPERDAGVHTAFMFTMCEGALELISAQAAPQRVRSWGAREEWLPFPDFSNQLHSPPFSALLGCDSWQLTSQLVFPSRRHQNRAVAAVEVVPAAVAPGQRDWQVFTFCLEKVEQGSLKNCWLTVGVRTGDYANV